jgi:hypothetical protein
MLLAPKAVAVIEGMINLTHFFSLGDVYIFPVNLNL